MQIDPVFWLLVLLGLALLGSLVTSGVRETAASMLSGFRWIGLLVLGLILSVLGVISLAALLCALVAGFCLLLALLVLVLAACMVMVPLLALGGVGIVGCMELLP
jgi:hypothetical protein